jgi:hypothetical protein
LNGVERGLRRAFEDLETTLGVAAVVLVATYGDDG